MEAPEETGPPVIVGPPTLADMVAILARIDERLDAIEDALAIEAENRVELAKVEWAIKHGRKRPW